MAKLTARGTHKVASVQYDMPLERDDNGRVTDTYVTLALRSDGVVLRKVTWTYRNTAIGTYSNSGNYTTHGTLKAGLPITKETLERIGDRQYGRRYPLRTGPRKG